MGIKQGCENLLAERCPVTLDKPTESSQALIFLLTLKYTKRTSVTGTFKSEILQKKFGAKKDPDLVKSSSENMNSTSMRTTFSKLLREKMEINKRIPLTTGT